MAAAPMAPIEGRPSPPEALSAAAARVDALCCREATVSSSSRGVSRPRLRARADGPEAPAPWARPNQLRSAALKIPTICPGIEKRKRRGSCAAQSKPIGSHKCRTAPKAVLTSRAASSAPSSALKVLEASTSSAVPLARPALSAALSRESSAGVADAGPAGN
eukprot:scaffold19606_cov84-Isochrysis_galbana.AAC.8